MGDVDTSSGGRALVPAPPYSLCVCVHTGTDTSTRYCHLSTGLATFNLTIAWLPVVEEGSIRGLSGCLSDSPTIGYEGGGFLMAVAGNRTELNYYSVTLEFINYGDGDTGYLSQPPPPVSVGRVWVAHVFQGT